MVDIRGHFLLFVEDVEINFIYRLVHGNGLNDFGCQLRIAVAFIAIPDITMSVVSSVGFITSNPQYWCMVEEVFEYIFA